MNVERLHSVLVAVKEDVDDSKTQSLLQQLRDALNQLASQPQQEQQQRQVASLRDQLSSSLAAAASNDYSPVWRQTLDELGLSSILGHELAARVDEIFIQNELTPAAAADQLGEILDEFTQHMAAVEGAINAFSALEIGSEELSPGEVEVSVLVPRLAVANEFNALGVEMLRLDKVLGVFVELGTGSRPPLTVRFIASSDFSFFLDVAPEAGAFIAVAAERVVALYKKLLEIRRLRSELAEQGLGDDSLVGIDEHANSHMSTGIEEIGEQLVEDLETAVKDGNRLNELKVELKLSLNAIANRIDAGYHIDVRVGALPESTDEKDGEEAGGTATHGSAAVDHITAAHEGLQFIRLAGSPILQLPEPDGEEDPGPKSPDSGGGAA